MYNWFQLAIIIEQLNASSRFLYLFRKQLIHKNNAVDLKGSHVDENGRFYSAFSCVFIALVHRKSWKNRIWGAKLFFPCKHSNRWYLTAILKAEFYRTANKSISINGKKIFKCMLWISHFQLSSDTLNNKNLYFSTIYKGTIGQDDSLK